MIRAWTRIFAGATRFALLCPLLFLLPVAVELLQHWAEVHVGMYASIAAAKAVEHDPLRMAIGHAKVIALFLLGYWVVRFLAHGDSAREAVRYDRVAVRLFAWVMAWGLFWLVLVQDGPALAPALGLSPRAMAFTQLGVILASMFFELCLSAWKAAAPLGNARITFLRSLAMILGSFWWAVGLMFLTVIPLLVVHYVLAAVAIGKGPAVLWTVLAIDAVLAAYLGVVMVVFTYVLAERMAVRHGETLMP
ncbi:hypothetical protein [Sphingomonas sp. KR3-1]|uniref:hypothetical protein n=1 Tax=Sphingomonas sp. KR3-1 TaxID=3156611 RepID=UPI0032B56641